MNLHTQDLVARVLNVGKCGCCDRSRSIRIPRCITRGEPRWNANQSNYPLTRQVNLQVRGLDVVPPGSREEGVGNDDESDNCGESFFEGFYSDTESHDGTRSMISASHGQLTIDGNSDVRLTQENQFSQ